MSLFLELAGCVLRQVVGEGAFATLDLVQARFLDPSQALPRALSRAAERSWKTLGIALAGDSLFDRIKRLFNSAEQSALREQIQLFLKSQAGSFEGTAEDFRAACLTEWKQVRLADLLAPTGDAAALAQTAAGFQRYTDPTSLIVGMHQAVLRLADHLDPRCPKLASLLRQPTTEAGEGQSPGTPLLAAAFAYFFRQEVHKDDELAHELLLENLRTLTVSHLKAFAELNRALETIGQQFDRLFEQLDRIEGKVDVVHEGVLDLHGQMQHLSAKQTETHALVEKVLALLSQLGMQRGEVRPQHSLSIHGESDRQAVRQLLQRFRQLPAEQQKQLPALLNGLGKLQVGIGDFSGASKTFAEVADSVADPTAQAEAAFNAYRSALEEKNWPKALDSLRQAAQLAPARFAPFPLRRYQLKQVLGAGGFGTAFLCRDVHFGQDVVVKTLHTADMERAVESIFAEAQSLRQVSSPTIIGVRDCDYADPQTLTRPYLVMDYFPGSSLADRLEHGGPLSPSDLTVVALQIADGMQAAHARGVLHRDLKPENILVRKDSGGWQVRIIDFGLALRRQTVESSLAARSASETILGQAVAGTLRYAPPEQMGEWKQQGKSVPVGPYSDVYAFGKLCCFALFKTTEPRQRNWASSPEHAAWQPILEGCLDHDLAHRTRSFDPIVDWLRRRSTPAPRSAPFPAAIPCAGPKPGDLYTNSLGMKFVWVPPGTFLMGHSVSDPERASNETQHKVLLTRGFWLGVHSVTQQQWHKVMGKNPSRFQGETRPVEGVSWQACQVFCGKLGLLDGKSYRLPTEAEWEYACRAGTRTRFSFGETLSPDQANFDGTPELAQAGLSPASLPPVELLKTMLTSAASGLARAILQPRLYRAETTPVGSFPGNAWGLFDMHGNVWEWCNDWYGDYPSQETSDPQGPATGTGRILRGGSWFSRSRTCGSATRSQDTPGSSDDRSGLRVVLCLS